MAASTGSDGGGDKQKGSNRIQVSSSKRPMFFYINLAKRLLGEHEDVSLSALGMAVSTMVSIAEILKKDGLAVETKLATSMETLGEDRQRPVQKAKMEIVLKRTPEFFDIVAAEAAEAKEGEEGEEHEHEEEEES